MAADGETGGRCPEEAVLGAGPAQGRVWLPGEPWRLLSLDVSCGHDLLLLEPHTGQVALGSRHGTCWWGVGVAQNRASIPEALLTSVPVAPWLFPSGPPASTHRASPGPDALQWESGTTGDSIPQDLKADAIGAPGWLS